MATALIKYDLTDSDDRMEFDRANKATDMALVLWELKWNYKKKFYRQLEADINTTEHHYELVDSIFESIFDLMDERGIVIDDLIQ